MVISGSGFHSSTVTDCNRARVHVLRAILSISPFHNLFTYYYDLVEVQLNVYQDSLLQVDANECKHRNPRNWKNLLFFWRRNMETDHRLWIKSLLSGNTMKLVYVHGLCIKKSRNFLERICICGDISYEALINKNRMSWLMTAPKDVMSRTVCMLAYLYVCAAGVSTCREHKACVTCACKQASGHTAKEVKQEVDFRQTGHWQNDSCWIAVVLQQLLLKRNHL